MKTETQITKDNVKNYIQYKGTGFERIWQVKCEEHKSSCQRFLGFLEGQEKFIKINDQSEETPCCKYNIDNAEFYCEVHQVLIDIQNKIQDLKQALKLYGEAGI